MPKNWGRLVSATLSESVKLASVSERCGFIYSLTLPHHDGEGRIPVDDVSLVDLCGRCAIVHGWTLEKMPAIREEIGRAGLWRVYQSARGGLAAEVVDWWKHQRMDKIRRGSDLMAEGELPHDVPLSVRLTVPTLTPVGANVGANDGSPTGGLSVGSEVKISEYKKTQEPRARVRKSKDDAGLPTEFDGCRWAPDEIEHAFAKSYGEEMKRPLRVNRKDREEFLLRPCPELNPVDDLEDFFADAIRALLAKSCAVTLRSCVNAISWVPLLADGSPPDEYDNPRYLRGDQIDQIGKTPQ